MKKTLAIIVTLAALAAMAYGVIGTGAWFTTSGQINNNYVTTGNLKLEVTGGPFTGPKLEPGGDYKSFGTFCLKNIGDYNMKFRGWMVDVGDSAGLGQYLRVKAILNPTGQAGNYGPLNATIFEDVPFNALTGPNTYILLSPSAEPLYPNLNACYEIQVRLASNAPNAVQAATLGANFYIQATQYINTGWAE